MKVVFSLTIEKIARLTNLHPVQKLLLLPYPSKILEKAAERITVDPRKANISYLLKACDGICQDLDLDADFDLRDMVFMSLNVNTRNIEKAKIEDLPDDLIQKINEYSKKENEENKKENTRTERPISEEELERRIFTTTFESRSKLSAPFEQGISKPIAEYSVEDLTRFKINQVIGRIMTNYSIDIKGDIHLNLDGFESEFLSKEELLDIFNKLEQKDLEYLVDATEKKIFKSAVEFSILFKEKIEEGKEKLIIKEKLPIKKGVITFTKEQSVQELATYNDLLNSDWFRNASKINSPFMEKAKALAKSMINFHRKNINKVDK